MQPWKDITWSDEFNFSVAEIAGKSNIADVRPRYGLQSHHPSPAHEGRALFVSANLHPQPHRILCDLNPKPSEDLRTQYILGLKQS